MIIIKYAGITILINDDFFNATIIAIITAGIIITTVTNIITINLANSTRPSSMPTGSAKPIANNEDDNIRNAVIISPILIVIFLFVIKTPNILL